MIQRTLSVLIILGFASAGYSQSADSTQVGAAEADSATVQQAEQTIPAFRPRPLILPWEWQDLSGLPGTAVFTAPLPPAAGQLTLLPPAAASGNPYSENLTGFQGSTAFLFDYTTELRRLDKVQPEYGNTAVMVPVLPLALLGLYGAQQGFLALHKDPPIAFDETDLAILDLIWEEPQQTAVAYYEQYNQTGSPHHLTYMVLQQRLDKLLRQKVLDIRTDGDHRRHYTARYGRTELLKLLEAELSKLSGEPAAARMSELQRMTMLLRMSERD